MSNLARRFIRYIIISGCAVPLLCWGASAALSNERTVRKGSSDLSTETMFLDEVASESVLARVFVPQDASQKIAAHVPSKQNKPELPEGDGKQLAMEYCQDCHSLTSITTAHKSGDEWRETVMDMIDRGARLPENKIDTLVQYLAKNFGPKQAASVRGTGRRA
jgi:mono/diheme cytochrome c family protein